VDDSSLSRQPERVVMPFVRLSRPDALTVSSSQLENVCEPLTVTVVRRWRDCSTPAGRLKKSFWPCSVTWKIGRCRFPS